MAWYDFPGDVQLGFREGDRRGDVRAGARVHREIDTRSVVRYVLPGDADHGVSGGAAAVEDADGVPVGELIGDGHGGSL